MTWTQKEAIELCTILSKVAPAHGAFIGLTGGTLYSEGERKDLDIIIYRCRQVDQIDWRGLFNTFDNLGIEIGRNHGFVKKATYKIYDREQLKYVTKNIDFLYPEHSGECPGYIIEE